MRSNKVKFSFLIVIMAIMFNLTFTAPAHAGWLWDAYSSAKETVSNVIDTGKKVVEAGVDAAKKAKEVVENTVNYAYETAKNAVKSVISFATGIGKEAANTASTVVNAAADGVQKAADVAKKIPQDVASKVNEAVNEVKDYVGDVAKEVGKGIQEAGKDVGKIVNDGKAEFNKFKQMISDFKEKGIDFVDKLKKEGQEKILNPVVERLKKQAQAAVDFGKETASDFGKITKDVDKTLFNGKGGQIAKDVLAPLITKDKNSVQIAQLLNKEFKSDSKLASQKGSAKFGFGGISTTTDEDIEGHANRDISDHHEMAAIDAYLGPRFSADYNGKFFGGKVGLTANTTNTLGAWAAAKGDVKWMKDGAVLDAKGEVKVGVGAKTENNVQLTTNIGGGMGTKTSAHVEATAGAEASAKGTAYLGKNGIELSGKAEAKCGAWVEGSANHAVQYKGQDLFGVGVGGGAGLGVGAGVEGGFSFKANRVGFQDVGFTLGPIKVKGSFYVNPVGLAELAVDKGKQAVKAVGNVAEKAVDKGKELLGKLKFW